MSIEDYIPRIRKDEADEHEALRQDIARQIDEFFARGGEVEEVPFGESADRQYVEMTKKGSSGARLRYKDQQWAFTQGRRKVVRGRD